jgi:hypothetical protein
METTNRTFNTHLSQALAAGLLIVLNFSSSAHAIGIFSADFNDFTAPEGNFNGGQFESGLAVAHSGDLPDWEKSGGGTVHVVDTANVHPDIDNPRNFAVMIWQDNVITQLDAIAGSNAAGIAHTVEFVASATVYQAPSQVTTASDGLLIEVLRPDDTVLESYVHDPGAWAGDIALVPDSFEYTGDGSGDIRLRIGPSAPGSGHFAGAIDNVSLSVVTPAIFAADFNDLSAPDGNFNGGQFESELPVVFAAEVPGWEHEGGNAIHAVDTANVFPDLDNPRDFAVMIWQDNVITQVDPIPGSNVAGIDYLVAFSASPAVYQAGSQQTSEDDGLLIEILRDDDTLLTEFTHEPGAWEGDIVLAPGGFNYTGDGSGDIRIRIGPSAFGSGRFGGAIDNVELSIFNADGPKITSFTAHPAELTVPGGPVMIEWLVEMPVDSLKVTPGDINVLGDTNAEGRGGVTIDPGPIATTAYTLTATRDGESSSRVAAVTIPAPEIVSFEANPPSATAGGELTLSWKVGLPANTLTLAPGDIDLLPNTDASGVGTITLSPGPIATTTFTLTAARGASTSTAMATRSIFDPDSIFFEGFDDYTGTQNSLQFESDLEVSHSGSATGWESGGQNAIHAVNQNGAGDFAAMIWHNNVLTLTDPIAANGSGVTYDVEFLAGPAVYAAGSQTTGDEEGLLIEILLDDDTVLAEFTYEPGPWKGFPTLVPVGFQYTGDGSGDVRIRIGPSFPNSGRFGGAIDSLTISENVTTLFQITDLARDFQTGAVTVTFTSVEGANYSVEASTDLLNWQELDDGVIGTVETTDFTDSFFAPENPLEAYYRATRQ